MKRFALLLLLLLSIGYLLAVPVNPVTSDLARHLKNGENIAHAIRNADWNTFWAVTKTNYYAAGHAAQPFINHHWGAGLVFYLLHQALGMTGLHLAYLALLMGAIGLMLRIAIRIAGFLPALLAAAILLPLLTARPDVRPEGFSYFFIALFLSMLSGSTIKPHPNTLLPGEGNKNLSKKMNTRAFFFIPLFLLLWVNLHIYFFFGILLAFLFLLRSGVCAGFPLSLFPLRSSSTKKMAPLTRHRSPCIILFLCLLAPLANPNGLSGALYPLYILSGYGYDIVENKSVWFLLRWGFTNLEYHLIPFVFLFILLIAFRRVILSSRDLLRSRGNPVRFNDENTSHLTPHKSFTRCSFSEGGHLIVLPLLTGTLSLFAVRNGFLFALTALPLFSQAIAGIFASLNDMEMKSFSAGTFRRISLLATTGSILMMYIFLCEPLWPLPHAPRGLGYVPDTDRAARFLSEQTISGPIFNNYDIGSYLIGASFWTEQSKLSSPSFPQKNLKVFVDNRPEAYPRGFFRDLYIPMQEDDQQWKQEENRQGFSLIVFSYRDYTPWAQTFLRARLADPSWIPIFADPWAIIMAKDTPDNDALITRFAIPREQFTFQ